VLFACNIKISKYQNITILKRKCSVQINSSYTAYSLPSEKSYHKEVKAEQGNKTPVSQDTVSISIEAIKLANGDSPIDPNFASEGLDKYRNGYGYGKTNDNMNFMEKVEQALMDRRTGIDREKIDEINEKMEEIMNDKSIPAEKKADMLEKLEEEKQQELEKAADKTAEQAKKEAEQPK
jgi:hypothetical protein